LRRDRQPRAVGEHQRVEADAEARRLLELAASFDLTTVPSARAGGNHHGVADADVARHAGFHAILDAGTFARYWSVRYEPDDRVSRYHQLLERLLGGSGARRIRCATRSSVGVSA
jgi:hypothetical protein